jgi:hypothetical protein
MPEYVKVRIYEPTYTETRLERVFFTKWSLFKIWFLGTFSSNAIYYKGDAYYLYKLDKDSGILIGNVEKEEE